MQLCSWSIDGWEKKKSRPIQAPPGYPAPLAGETRVQFHNNQSHVLVVHESQIAIYDAQLECLRSVSVLGSAIIFFLICIDQIVSIHAISNWLKEYVGFWTNQCLQEPLWKINNSLSIQTSKYMAWKIL